VNCSTTRGTTPAAAPRTGQGRSAPQTLPFSALPHELRKDPRLKGYQTAIVLAATLLEYARTKPYCYPSNARLADDMGCCISTIRNALTALRAAGWVRLELGSNQPNGRKIWLTWRCATVPPNGESRGTRDENLAPNPSLHKIPLLVPQVSDPIQPVGPPTQPAEPPTQPAEPPTQPTEPECRIVVVEAKEESPEEVRSTPPVQRSRAALPVPTAAPQPARTLPFDLGAIGKPPTSFSVPATTAPTPTPQRRRPRLGLTLEELAKVAGETADPILAAELARRTGPKAPPEPPPALVPTAELLTALPGRHDLIMVAARRLCEETGDYKTASQRTFEKMAEAVATRAVPATVLINCWRQGMGPQAEHRGKVLVAAWQREARDYGKPVRC
jgi:helix-turn-helix protein